MQLSQDILLYIGQNYLKDLLCIKKLFYYYKDDELQTILFGEVLYKHKQLPKTTIPLDFISPDRNSASAWYRKHTNITNNNQWIFYNLTPFHQLKKNIFNSIDEFCDLFIALRDRQSNDEYQIYLTFEKKKQLLIKLEYIIYNGYDNEPVIYSDEFISYTLSHEKLRHTIPDVYKTIKKEIYKQIIN